MSLASRARRVAIAAAYGGGGLGVAGGALSALLFAEAKLARHWVGLPEADPPVTDGLYGHGADEPLSMAMLGDSSAAGLGVDDPHDTPAVRLACGLSEVAGRTVRLRSVAVVGARSSHLEAQVTRALASQPDIAVIMIGANDVTHVVRPSLSVRQLDDAVRRLRAAGAEVVVATCPDLGTIEPIAQPLRLIARQWSRQLAAAQTIAVVEAGGRSVSLGDLLGPEFAAAPHLLFGPDRFHPSAEGYASAAAVLLPAACAALGLWVEPTDVPEPAYGLSVLPVAEAAAEAAEQPGTEVAATRVEGRERGPQGRWALLRRARRGTNEPAAAP